MDRGGSGGSNTGLEMPIECVGSEWDVVKWMNMNLMSAGMNGTNEVIIYTVKHNLELGSRQEHNNM